MGNFIQGVGNLIEPSASIGENVVIGSYNYIGKNVVISGFKDKQSKVFIGDCNFIHDNTRILIGEEGLILGDWNVFHNNMLVIGDKRMEIGHNCWFGQNTIIDSTGGLTIGNGVRVGMYSQIWTHVGSGELIEGCTLFSDRKTIIEDDVWLVGSCIVASGLTLRYRSTCLIGSNLTKSTDSYGVYGGNPAKVLNGLSFWKEVSLLDKFEMMKTWIIDFSNQHCYKFEISNESTQIKIFDHNSEAIIFIGSEFDFSVNSQNISMFDIKTKQYSKNLTELERKFYRFLFDHKARFLPFCG